MKDKIQYAFEALSVFLRLGKINFAKYRKREREREREGFQAH